MPSILPPPGNPPGLIARADLLTRDARGDEGRKLVGLGQADAGRQYGVIGVREPHNPPGRWM